MGLPLPPRGSMEARLPSPYTKVNRTANRHQSKITADDTVCSCVPLSPSCVSPLAVVNNSLASYAVSRLKHKDRVSTISLATEK